MAASTWARSYLVTGALLGMDVRIVAPKHLWPDEALIDEAKAVAQKTGARVPLTDDVAAGVKGADFLLTDVWVSMGEAGRCVGRAHQAAEAVSSERQAPWN